MKVKVQTEKVLPVFMRDNKPRIHAIPIIHYRPDGLPDGVHCGAWLDVDTRKVWKLLYGRPYVNADVIVRKFEKVEQNPVSNRFGKYIIAVIENGHVKTFLVEKEINPKNYMDGKLTSWEKVQ